MPPEKEPTPNYTVSEMTPEDTKAVTLMRCEVWLDTYINHEHGVTREWIENRFAERLTDEADDDFKKSVINKTENEKYLVAKDSAGKVIGAATACIKNDGNQELETLYTLKQWHGKGVGDNLMRQAMDWFDTSKPIKLGVIVYNARAKKFYGKWGFEEIHGSEKLFADKILEVKMVRKGDKNEIQS